VVDNANEPEVAELVREQQIEATYLGSAHNLGGAGGFALGMLHALTKGADWVWLADDDAGPRGRECSPPCSIARPGTVWSRFRRWSAISMNRIGSPSRCAAGGVAATALRAGCGGFLPGIASLFNGALISAKAVDLIGVPDLRLFVRGDEVEVHRRLVRSGLPFGTCLQTAYLHPTAPRNSSDSRRPHAHPVPDDRSSATSPIAIAAI